MKDVFSTADLCKMVYRRGKALHLILALARLQPIPLPEHRLIASLRIGMERSRVRPRRWQEWWAEDRTITGTTPTPMEHHLRFSWHAYARTLQRLLSMYGPERRERRDLLAHLLSTPLDYKPTPLVQSLAAAAPVNGCWFALRDALLEEGRPDLADAHGSRCPWGCATLEHLRGGAL